MNNTQQPQTAQKQQNALGELHGAELNKVLVKYAEGQPSPKAYIELIKSQIMGFDQRGNPRPTEDLIYFLSVAHKTGLDPLARQIYPVYRWNSKVGRETMVIQTGIDGFRLVAQRTKDYGGQDDIKYTVEQIYNPVTGEDVKQLTATATVYRINPKNGERMPVQATARWNEYVQKGKDGKPMGMWASMPYNQLGKCSEALALRKGFAQELSGLYTDDEMGQAENAKSLIAELPKPPSIQARTKVVEAEKPAEESQPTGEPQAEDAKKPVDSNEAKEQIKPTHNESVQDSLLKKHSELKEGGAK